MLYYYYYYGKILSEMLFNSENICHIGIVNSNMSVCVDTLKTFTRKQIQLSVGSVVFVFVLCRILKFLSLPKQLIAKIIYYETCYNCRTKPLFQFMNSHHYIYVFSVKIWLWLLFYTIFNVVINFKKSLLNINYIYYECTWTVNTINITTYKIK